ncbi:MAG: hypothetical protein SNJ50_10445 [Cyanobacteriota bacterium]
MHDYSATHNAWLHQAMFAKDKINYLDGWREINSERDTVTANQTDVQVFLRSLLQLQEDE